MSTAIVTKKEALELKEENESLRSRFSSYGRRALAKKGVGIDMGAQLAGSAVGGAAAAAADHYDQEGIALISTGASLALGAAMRIKNPNDVAGKLAFSTGCGSVAYLVGKETKAWLEEEDAAA